MITEAQYRENPTGNNDCIRAIIDGIEKFVPLDTDNKDYQEILEWVDAGNTITPA